MSYLLWSIYLLGDVFRIFDREVSTFKIALEDEDILRAEIETNPTASIQKIGFNL